MLRRRRKQNGLGKGKTRMRDVLANAECGASAELSLSSLAQVWNFLSSSAFSIECAAVVPLHVRHCFACASRIHQQHQRRTQMRARDSAVVGSLGAFGSAPPPPPLLLIRLISHVDQHAAFPFPPWIYRRSVSRILLRRIVTRRALSRSLSAGYAERAERARLVHATRSYKRTH